MTDPIHTTHPVNTPLSGDLQVNSLLSKDNKSPSASYFSIVFNQTKFFKSLHLGSSNLPGLFSSRHIIPQEKDGVDLESPRHPLPLQEGLLTLASLEPSILDEYGLLILLVATLIVGATFTRKEDLSFERLTQLYQNHLHKIQTADPEDRKQAIKDFVKFLNKDGYLREVLRRGEEIEILEPEIWELLIQDAFLKEYLYEQTRNKFGKAISSHKGAIEILTSLRFSASKEVWEDVVSLLDSELDHRSKQQIVDYFATRIARWPQEVPRMAPYSWFTDLVMGGPLAQVKWGLANGLDASLQSLEDEGVTKLIGSDHLKNLKYLDLRGIGIGEVGLRYLASSSTLQQLESLDLSYNALGANEVRHLTKSTTLTQLKSLDLSYNYIDDAGAIYLAKANNLSRLQDLNLISNKIGNVGLWNIAESTRLSQLETLLLYHNRIGAQGPSVAPPITALSKLTHLDLAANQLGPAGAEYLINETNLLANLRILRLSTNGIGNRGAKALAEATSLKNLERLHLRHNRISDEGARDLAASLNLTSLRSMPMEGNEMGEAGQRAFRVSESLQNCHIIIEEGLELFPWRMGSKGGEGTQSMGLHGAILAATSLNASIDWGLVAEVGLIGAVTLTAGWGLTKAYSWWKRREALEQETQLKALEDSSTSNAKKFSSSKTSKKSAPQLDETDILDELKQHKSFTKFHALVGQTQSEDMDKNERAFKILVELLGNPKIPFLPRVRRYGLFDRLTIAPKVWDQLAKVSSVREVFLSLTQAALPEYVDQLNESDWWTLASLQAPSKEGWDKFVSLLNHDQNTTTLQPLLIFAQTRIAHWPQAVPRLAPYAWFKDLQSGDLTAQTKWSLANGLDAGEQGLGDAKIETFISSPQLTGIRHLILSRNHISEIGAKALANSPNLSSLKSLILWNNRLGEAGSTALANSPHLHSLSRLNLGSNNIGDAGARALANSPHLQTLTIMDLRLNGIGDTGATALAKSPKLPILTSLILSANFITDAGARALANSQHLQALTGLDLWGSMIGDEGATALANAQNLQTLSRLYLGSSVIGNAGAKALANSQYLHSLSILALEDNKIGNAGARALANAKHLSSLTSLILWNNNISNRGHKALRKSPYLKNTRIAITRGKTLNLDSNPSLALTGENGIHSVELFGSPIAAAAFLEPTTALLISGAFYGGLGLSKLYSKLKTHIDTSHLSGKTRSVPKIKQRKLNPTTLKPTNHHTTLSPINIRTQDALLLTPPNLPGLENILNQHEEELKTALEREALQNLREDPLTLRYVDRFEEDLSLKRKTGDQRPLEIHLQEFANQEFLDLKVQRAFQKMGERYEQKLRKTEEVRRGKKKK